MTTSVKFNHREIASNQNKANFYLRPDAGHKMVSVVVVVVVVVLVVVVLVLVLVVLVLGTIH